jgi:hypothetical protein
VDYLRAFRGKPPVPDELDDVARRMDETARRAGVYRTGTDSDPALFEADGQVTENAV